MNYNKIKGEINMMAKEDLIKRINEKYKTVEAVLQVVPKGVEDSLRSVLEACIKLFWLIKYDKEPVWVKNGKEEFNLNEAIKSEKFSQFFSPFLISDMHSIRTLGNGSTHNEIQGLSASELAELFNRLQRIIKAMEIVLKREILLPAKNEKKEEVAVSADLKNQANVGESNVNGSKNSLLGKMVQHWVYGEGKIIKIINNKIIVQFGNLQKEYGDSAFKDGFLKLKNEKKINATQVLPKTYMRTYRADDKNVYTQDYQTPMSEAKCEMDYEDFRFAKTISKYEAVSLFRNAGFNISRNCTFASKNRATFLYWANPKIDMLQDDWWLILNDNIKYELNLFKIPAGSIDLKDMIVRADKPYLIDLQIFYNDETFLDTRSCISFAKWYVKTLKY